MTFLGYFEMSLLQKFKDLKDFFSSEKSNLFGAILDVDFLKVDTEKSKHIKKGKMDILYLVSKDELHCPIEVGFGFLGKNEFVYLSLGKSGPIMEEKVKNNCKNLNEFEKGVRNMLLSEINEDLFYCRNKLIKAKYTIFTKLDNKRVCYPHRTYKRVLWFWEKPIVVRKEYQPWL